MSSSAAAPSSPDRKRQRTHATIVTHDGSFHADEVLACHLLRQLPEFKDAEIVRSRKPEIWATASILVDVGAEYNPALNKYDHHQREFQDTFSPAHKTRLSSAGLIYKHFGKRIIAQLMHVGDGDIENNAQVELVFNKLYDNLIEAFDGIDNGVSRFPRDTPEAYKDATNLSTIVAKLNPFWNEEGLTADGQFRVAMQIVGSHFDRTAKYLATAWVPARQAVLDAVAARHTYHAGGHVIVMPTFVPWKDHLDSIEADLGIAAVAAQLKAPIAENGGAIPDGLPLYVVFPDPAGSWRIQAVPLTPGSFENRKPLASAWRGLRDDNLDKVTGVPGGVFIHASGFIGGHQTKEGAIKLAEMAVNM
ncbi:metal-dependent protein hydrolase [Catenaria anguillulae PL171]|uniref:Metal-dependent protein hydrolase n=1 Tax=Catenaria anguillulae PL171 TaxID=765915 RepID=A0A1Y2I3E0_9FUNG|nr:metal-dependent protein hydrolase [Catenaria anguillulae PL171]